MYGYSVTPPKPRRKSKTHIFNAVMGVLAVLEMNAQLFQPVLPVNVYQVFTLVLIVGNAILRELTKQPVGGV